MDLPWVYGLAAVLLAYLSGSIPTSVWWGRAFYGVDVREHGSRNAGATNTFRVLGRKAGIPVLLIDVAKGFLPVFLLPKMVGVADGTPGFDWLRVALVVAAVVGHLYPVFAGFKGGKGVATSLGGVLAFHPGAAGVCVAVFLVVFLLSRYVSLSSLFSALSFPLSMAFLFHEDSTVKIGFAIALCLLVFYTHRENIGRLLKGQENRMNLAGRSGPSQ
ncbi:MAG: glycerol-3-phosphate 1-O-acyltransferase PlsY [Flavobacteriales bacterium]|nr:glycerol-3-phosphate 1-O-acyltransferase PlsY [Flavobacteriales bacterium]